MKFSWQTMGCGGVWRKCHVDGNSGTGSEGVLSSIERMLSGTTDEIR
jgi:hypothetical protein